MKELFSTLSNISGFLNENRLVFQENKPEARPEPIAAQEGGKMEEFKSAVQRAAEGADRGDNFIVKAQKKAEMIKASASNEGNEDPIEKIYRDKADRLANNYNKGEKNSDPDEKDRLQKPFLKEVSNMVANMVKGPIPSGREAFVKKIAPVLAGDLRTEFVGAARFSPLLGSGESNEQYGIEVAWLLTRVEKKFKSDEAVVGYLAKLDTYQKIKPGMVSGEEGFEEVAKK